jgi:hypothetical protein
MAVTGARPYLMPSASAVRFGIWSLFNQEWEPLPDSLETWDPEVSLRLSQTVELDVQQLLAETGLPVGAQFAVTASWTSATSGMKVPIARMETVDGGVVVLEGELDGRRIGGSLEIMTTVALVSLTVPVPVGVVASAGAVVAEMSTRVNVEPDLVRFPVAVVDFSFTKTDANASWRLETTTDLFAPFFGEFRLLINSRDTDLVHAVETRAPTTVDLTLIAEMEGQVAAFLYEFAIMNRDALREEDEWPSNSVGQVLSGFIHVADRHNLTAVAADPIDRPAFVARLAGLVRVQGQGRPFT